MIAQLLEYSEKGTQWLQGKGYGSASIGREVSAALPLLPTADAVVFDVGANKGAWTRELLARAGSKLSAVYCFEPSRHNHESLCSIRDERVTLIKRAVSDQATRATLYSEAGGSGMASLAHRRLDHFGMDPSLTEEVETTTLDEMIAERGITQVDFVKLDIEGYEYRAMLGGSHALEAGIIRALSFEFGGCNIDTRTYFQDFWYFLTERGFNIALINPIGVPRLITRYRESLEHFRTTNYLAWTERS